MDTLGTWLSVLYREVSSFQGCPLRGVPLYIYISFINLYICYKLCGEHMRDSRRNTGQRRGRWRAQGARRELWHRNWRSWRHSPCAPCHAPPRWMRGYAGEEGPSPLMPGEAPLQVSSLVSWGGREGEGGREEEVNEGECMNYHTRETLHLATGLTFERIRFLHSVYQHLWL